MMSFANITEISEEIAAQFDLTKTKSNEIVNFIVQGVIDELKVNGERVYVHGFGSFTPKITKARTARNPKTGEPVSVPAKSTIRFKPAPAMVASDNSSD